MGPEAFRERIKEAQNSFLFEISVLRRAYDMKDPGAEDPVLSGDSQKTPACLGRRWNGKIISRQLPEIR